MRVPPHTIKGNENLVLSIKKYGSYLLIRDWVGLKWLPVLPVRYGGSSKINTVKRHKTLIDESP